MLLDTFTDPGFVSQRAGWPGIEFSPSKSRQTEKDKSVYMCLWDCMPILRTFGPSMPIGLWSHARTVIGSWGRTPSSLGKTRSYRENNVSQAC